MAITRMEARELMNRGYEMGASVLSGLIQRRSDGTWTVDDVPLDECLDALQGQQALIVASAISEARGERRVCRVCGTEYEGHACPRCREVRQRLRGG